MKQTNFIFILLGLLAIGFTSCVTSERVNLMQKPSKTIPSYSDTVSFEDYRLRIGDRLYIRVYSIDPKTQQYFNSGMTNTYYLRNSNYGNTTNVDLYTYVVDQEGDITFPSLGKVHVRGLTTREIKHSLEDKLAGMVVQHGKAKTVSVEVQIVHRFFSVIGLSGTGRYAITKEKVTIYEAIAMAGDISDFGDRSKIHIVREIEDSTFIKTFDIRSEDIINSEYYYIEPNDVIYIQQMPGKAFGINSAGTAVSVVASTLSFGVFIYTLIDRYIIIPIQNNVSNETD